MSIPASLAYYYDHREEILAASRDRSLNDPDYARRQSQRAIEWQKKNPERVALRSVRRKARKRSVFVEDVHPLVVLERFDGECGICGGDVNPFNFHVDHIIPLALGGEHSYANTQPAHPQCNVRKGISL